MKHYFVTYRQEIITENNIVRADGFSSISFENIGTDNALLNSVIPLNNVGIAREFIEKPYCVIKDNFVISFEGVDADTRILVVKSYYQLID